MPEVLSSFLKMEISDLVLKASESNLVSGLLQKINKKEEINISGLSGSGKAWLLAYLFRQEKRRFLVMTYRNEEAQTLAQDLTTYLGEETVNFFLPLEVLPYEFETVDPEITGQRLKTLFELTGDKKTVTVATVSSFLEKTITSHNLRNFSISLKAGQKCDLDDLIQKLIQVGFQRETLVEEVGTFSVRGGILDVFTYTCQNPVRLEFNGNEISSIRIFSASTQRSISKIEKVDILPAQEIHITDPQILEKIHNLYHTQKIEEKIFSETIFPGINWLSIPFQIPTGTLCDFLPADTLIFLDEPFLIIEELKRLQDQCRQSFQNNYSKLDFLPPPELIWESAESFTNRLYAFQKISHSSVLSQASTVLDFRMNPPGNISSHAKLLTENIVEYQKEGYRVFIFCDNTAQKERLSELLEDLKSEVFLLVGQLSSGFVFSESKVLVLTDNEIFHRFVKRLKKKKFTEGISLSSYTALQAGDFVVHIDYGIGQYQGLESVIVDNRKRDCLLITYQGNDRLYVPIEEFNRVSKYTGKDGSPSLSKLGSPSWEKTKARTKEKLKEMAQELIALNAERKALSGFSFAGDSLWQKELEASFIYEETPDQLKALEDIKKDMLSNSPMDRLVCGDVGFGKTELAIRSSFKAVENGKQVAVLAPTTILALQHLSTFTERLKDFPLRVEMLSRFKNKKEQKKIVEELKEGKIDILIGTHRLLQKDIQFKDLGLLIIDEEHRFGVAHKEQLKKLKRLVDVLTLTATPIPRTMQLSLSGARDLSVINTPPKERLPIETHLVPFDPPLIAQAIQSELQRGGQIYFVHNRIETIYGIYDFLTQLIPQVKIAIAHGQMDEQKLEQVMVNFYHKKFDCLLSTTIIESGLDIPTVNTIIINRADKFGLAELYQLRGRVGRSNLKAYAYLIIPPVSTLSTTAWKRLKAIKEFTSLGSGFYLALKDLEIRGAGNLLGAQQHGFIEEVGFDLYCQLLEQAVRELKGEKTTPMIAPKLDFDWEANLPDDYISDISGRLEIYQKISQAQNLEQLEEVKKENLDRFGALPEAVENLFFLSELKILLTGKEVSQAIFKNSIIKLEFTKQKQITKSQIENWCKKIILPKEFSSSNGLKLTIDLSRLSMSEQKEYLRNLLPKL